MPESYIVGPARCPGSRNGKHKWPKRPFLAAEKQCQNQGCTAKKVFWAK